jgi:hypothetical protein
MRSAARRAGPLLGASPHCQRWEAARYVDELERQIVRIAWDTAYAIAFDPETKSLKREGVRSS